MQTAQQRPSSLYSIFEKLFAMNSRTSGRGGKDVSQRGNTPGFIMSGALSRGRNTEFAVDGEDVLLDANTWTIGVPTIGMNATVVGIFRVGGVRYARKLSVE